MSASKYTWAKSPTSVFVNFIFDENVNLWFWRISQIRKNENDFYVFLSDIRIFYLRFTYFLQIRLRILANTFTNFDEYIYEFWKICRRIHIFSSCIYLIYFIAINYIFNILIISHTKHCRLTSWYYIFLQIFKQIFWQIRIRIFCKYVYKFFANT